MGASVNSFTARHKPRAGAGVPRQDIRRQPLELDKVNSAECRSLVDLHVRVEGRKDLARQLYRQLRGAIAEGRLRPGERLPSTRELASRLELSRNTVALAYEWLTSEGLVSGRAGAGSFVDTAARPESVPTATAAAPELRTAAAWARVTRDFGRVAAGAFDFRPGIADPRLFPFDSWRRLVATQLRPKTLNGRYGECAGHPALRDAIAAHVGAARGVQASADDVIITNGAQHAFDLLARVLIEPGARVAVEDPGYPPIRSLLESFGAVVVGVRVDAQGLRVDALPSDAQLVYVTPSHQYPLGMPMSPERRLALLTWARQRNAVVIEDDYDSEFRFGGRPLDALHASDRGGRVAYVGTFSKTLLPKIRLGFLIAPKSIQEVLKTAQALTSWHCQWPAQGAMAEFIREGLFARHIRRMRREYAARHDKVVSIMERSFAPWLEPVPCVAGMHVSAFLRSTVAAEATLAAAAEQAGIGLHRLSPYYVTGRARPGLAIGYGGLPSERIDEGLRRLHTLTARAAGQHRRSRRA
jgi:GntR family transcriptional regulator/MocR family aminotransferase